MKRLVAIGLALLWLITPAAVSFFSPSQARLNTIRSGDGKSVSYLVAGLLGQSSTSFDFLLDSPILDGDTVIAVDYSNAGVDYNRITLQIIQDAEVHNYQEIKIFGISVGCAITHAISATVPEVKCYEINPCWTSQFLRSELRRWPPRAGLLALEIVDIIVGPLKFLPLIPSGKQNFSLHLIVDQIERVLSEPTSQADLARTQIVVLSENDEFLDNQTIASTYGDTPIIVIPSIQHARTSLDADGAAYREAFSQIS